MVQRIIDEVCAHHNIQRADERGKEYDNTSFVNALKEAIEITVDKNSNGESETKQDPHEQLIKKDSHLEITILTQSNVRVRKNKDSNDTSPQEVIPRALERTLRHETKADKHTSMKADRVQSFDSESNQIKSDSNQLHQRNRIHGNVSGHTLVQRIYDHYDQVDVKDKKNLHHIVLSMEGEKAFHNDIGGTKKRLEQKGTTNKEITVNLFSDHNKIKRKNTHESVSHAEQNEKPLVSVAAREKENIKKDLRRTDTRVTSEHLQQIDTSQKIRNDDHTEIIRHTSKNDEQTRSEIRISYVIERSVNDRQIDAKVTHDIPQNAPHRFIHNDDVIALLQNAKILHEGEKTTLSLRLYPESLGRLLVTVGLEQGILTGSFVVESEDAKELLQMQLEHIRAELENSGIHVGDFEVHVKKQFQNQTLPMYAITNAQQNAEYESTMYRYRYHEGEFDVVI